MATAVFAFAAAALAAETLPPARPSTLAPALEASPRPRPAADAALPGSAAPAAGALCGDPALVGSQLPSIAEGDGCGVSDPVSLASVDGVALDPPATVDCATARALAVWLRRGPVASFARQGAAVRRMVVVDAYSCRNRNRQTDGKLSEHAFGKAIDVAAFDLRDGRSVTVLDGWTSPDWGALLHRIHDAGCGPFGTVLGPEANALHADHLHLDTASRRSGAYCQ